MSKVDIPYRNAFMERAERLVRRRVRTGLPRKTASSRGLLASLGTARSYTCCLARYFEWLCFCGIGPEEQDHRQHLVDFLEDLAEVMAQSTVNQHRQALKLIFQVDGLPMLRAIKQTASRPRSYTWSEVKRIAERQESGNALATLLAYSAGLRAHELLTLMPAAEKPRSPRRKWSENLSLGMPYPVELFSVVGKGGLIRHVAIPESLTQQLEKLRTPPNLVIDRGIRYLREYELGYGQSFCQSFTTASHKALGFSHGAHGLRHSYIKRRLKQMLDSGLEFSDAQLIVSQEVGHFRPGITLCYMR